MVYYSQHGQDIWIIETVFNHLKYGFFIDIGASDGIETSNSYALEENYEWKGICVEPRLEVFGQLVLNRNCICENICIWDGSQNIASFVEAEDHTSGIVAPFSDLGVIEQSFDYDNIRARKSLSLNQLVNKHRAPSPIHYLTIDTEGAEYEILKAFDFSTHKILAITVEHNSYLGRKQCEKRAAIKHLLLKNDFLLSTELGSDDCYLLKNYKDYI